MAAFDASSSESTLHPPRPVLAFRVGVTGHRPKPTHFLPPEAQERVESVLRRTFENIDTALAEARKIDADFYDAAPHQVRLVSGLAEGADQLAAQLCPPGWALDAILPFPVETYKKDFEKSALDETRNVVPGFEAACEKASTVLALPDIDDSAEPNRGYVRLAHYLVRQVDLLIAVWDGKPAESAGGSGDVVRYAFRAGVPVVWISTTAAVAAHNFFARMLSGFGPDALPEGPEVDCTHGALAVAVAEIVSVPKDALFGLRSVQPKDATGPSPDERLRTFLQERWPRRSRSVVYDLFTHLVQRKKLRLSIPVPYLPDRLAEWNLFFNDAPAAKALESRLRACLLPRYIWADQLAIDFANKYRTAYILSYLLAAVAVGIGAYAGLFAHASGAAVVLSGKGAEFLVEASILSFVGFLYAMVKKRNWHRKWLEYRALAEILRDVRFLAYLGEYGQIRPTNGSELAGTSWGLWYLRATVRELGLPSATLDGAFQDQLLRAVETHVIVEQLQYHYPNAVALGKTDKRLQAAVQWSFYIIILVLFTVGLLLLTEEKRVLPDEIWTQVAAPFTTFCAVFLPALSAALASIRETGDFEGFALRSERTAEALEELRTKLIPMARKTVSLDETANVLFATAQVLTEDLTTWLALYGRKRLDLRP
jgi:hypothetical protein